MENEKINEEPTLDSPVNDTPVDEKGDDGITFDYNQLYADLLKESEKKELAEKEDEFSWDIEEVPINFEEPQQEELTYERNVIPTFDTSVLEGTEQPTEETEAPQLIHTMKKEEKQEKSTFVKNLIFIAIFFGILIFVVLVIFPLMV